MQKKLRLKSLGHQAWWHTPSTYSHLLLKSLKSGTGEVALQSHVHIALPRDLRWIPSTHAWLITTPCNYSPVWFNFLFWPLLCTQERCLI